MRGKLSDIRQTIDVQLTDLDIGEIEALLAALGEGSRILADRMKAMPVNLRRASAIDELEKVLRRAKSALTTTSGAMAASE